MESIFKNCVVRKTNNGGVMYERENKCCYVEYLKNIFIHWNYTVYVEYKEEINEKHTFIKYFS